MAVFMIFLMAALIVPLTSEAQGRGRGFGGQDSYENMPYGQTCPGPRWGGHYGQRKTVKTSEEAKQEIEKYFAASGRTVKIVRVEERKGYFELDIANPDGTLIDTLIIHKRSGSIRSIY